MQEFPEPIEFAAIYPEKVAKKYFKRGPIRSNDGSVLLHYDDTIEKQTLPFPQEKEISVFEESEMRIRVFLSDNVNHIRRVLKKAKKINPLSDELLVFLKDYNGSSTNHVCHMILGEKAKTDIGLEKHFSGKLIKNVKLGTEGYYNLIGSARTSKGNFLSELFDLIIASFPEVKSKKIDDSKDIKPLLEQSIYKESNITTDEIINTYFNEGKYKEAFLYLDDTIKKEELPQPEKEKSIFETNSLDVKVFFSVDSIKVLELVMQEKKQIVPDENELLVFLNNDYRQSVKEFECYLFYGKGAEKIIGLDKIDEPINKLTVAKKAFQKLISTARTAKDNFLSELFGLLIETFSDLKPKHYDVEGNDAKTLIYVSSYQKMIKPLNLTLKKYGSKSHEESIKKILLKIRDLYRYAPSIERNPTFDTSTEAKEADSLEKLKKIKSIVKRIIAIHSEHELILKNGGVTVESKKDDIAKQKFNKAIEMIPDAELETIEEKTIGTTLGNSTITPKVIRQMTSAISPPDSQKFSYARSRTDIGDYEIASLPIVTELIDANAKKIIESMEKGKEKTKEQKIKDIATAFKISEEKVTDILTSVEERKLSHNEYGYAILRFQEKFKQNKEGDLYISLIQRGTSKGTEAHLPIDYLRDYEGELFNKLELIGVYHTHPVLTSSGNSGIDGNPISLQDLSSVIIGSAEKESFSGYPISDGFFLIADDLNGGRYVFVIENLITASNELPKIKSDFTTDEKTPSGLTKKKIANEIDSKGKDKKPKYSVGKKHRQVYVEKIKNRGVGLYYHKASQENPTVLERLNSNEK